MLQAEVNTVHNNIINSMQIGLLKTSITYYSDIEKKTKPNEQKVGFEILFNIGKISMSTFELHEIYIIYKF